MHIAMHFVIMMQTYYLLFQWFVYFMYFIILKDDISTFKADTIPEFSQNIEQWMDGFVGKTAYEWVAREGFIKEHVFFEREKYLVVYAANREETLWKRVYWE